MPTLPDETVLDRQQPDSLPPPLTAIRQRLMLLKWAMPLALFLIVVIFELGPSRWIHDDIGDAYHFLAEIVIYGSIGPSLAFAFLHFLGRWLEERETSDLQALILARTRQQAEMGHQLSDKVLQDLFAASALLASLEAHASELPPDAQAQFHQAQATLNQTVQQLRVYLLRKTSKE